MTEVVNLRKYPGSGMFRILPDSVVRVDRASKWGNPFRVSRTVSRTESIALYRIWLQDRLKLEPDFLEPLRGRALGCWCHPKACHAAVIAEFLNGPR